MISSWARFFVIAALGAAAAQAQNCPPVEAPPRIGAEATGKCTAVTTSFGCFTYVDGGRIVGRVCNE